MTRRKTERGLRVEGPASSECVLNVITGCVQNMKAALYVIAAVASCHAEGHSVSVSAGRRLTALLVHFVSFGADTLLAGLPPSQPQPHSHRFHFFKQVSQPVRRTKLHFLFIQRFYLICFVSFTVVYVSYHFFFIIFFSELPNCQSRWPWA